MSAPPTAAAAARTPATAQGEPCRDGADLGPAEGWQGRFLGWLNRRKRLSVLVPVVVLVLGTPHSCPFC